MKRKSNKLISFLLALTMLLNTLPLTVWANEGDSSTPPADDEPQIEQLSEPGEGESDTGSEGSGGDGDKEDEQIYTLDIDEDGCLVGITGTLPADFVIPDTVKEIGEQVFRNRSELKTVKLPNTLEVLGPGAFLGCVNLQSVEIPMYLKNMGPNPFQDCNNLTEISRIESVVSTTRNISVMNNCLLIRNNEVYSCLNSNVRDSGEVEIPEGITAVNQNAFNGCTNVISVNLPNTIEELAPNAFAGCSSLTTINYEGTEAEWEKITLGENAIPNVVSIICRDTVTDLESWTFTLDDKGNAFITSYKGTFTDGKVTVPSKVYDDNGEHTVRFIGAEAFKGRTDVVTVTLPENLKRINDSAFSGCTSLTSITIPDNVNYIGSDAFNGCTKLTELSIPKGMEEIDADAFAGCTMMISYPGIQSQWDQITARANIPNTVTVKCTGKEGWVYDVDEEDSVLTITGYNGTFEDGLVQIPGSINIGTEENPDNRTVIAIGNSAFKGRDDVVTVRMPNSVQNLRGSAFRDCTNLTTVQFGDNLRNINSDAFRGCTKLTSITIPTSVEFIGPNVFLNSGLTTINYEGTQYQWNRIEKANNAVPENVTVNYNGTVGWKFEINEDDEVILLGYSGEFTNSAVTLPSKVNVGTEANPVEKDVTWIGTDAFSNRRDITSVTIPETVRGLMGGAFSDCSELTSVTLPAGFRRLNNQAFKNCTQLTTINIPDSVDYIGNQAFMGCESLKTITLPTSIEKIGEMAFADCNTDLVITYLGTGYQWGLIEKGNNAVPTGVAVNCTGAPGWTFATADDGALFLTGYSEPLTGEITLPVEHEGEKVEFVGGNTFNGQTEITKLIVPEGYVHINPDSFKGCTSLTEISLPQTIRHIGLWCFFDCPKLEKVYYPGRKDQWEENVEVLDHAFEPHDIDDILVFGDDGIYDLSGTVKKSDGTPISGATVTLIREDNTVETCTTGEDGIYRFTNLNYNYSYPITVTVEGYDSRTVSLQLDKDTMYDFIFYTAAEYAANIDLAHLRENEIAHFNTGIAEGKGDRLVLSNVLSGLTEMGANGQVVPALAESWTHDDGYTQWTFKIRDNVSWVDVNGKVKGTVTAADFATALEWMLNSQKNPEGHSSAVMHEMLNGAWDYTQYTESISTDAAWALQSDSDDFTSTVGISVDSATNSITFNLTKPVSYFPTVLTGSNFLSFSPMSQAMIEEVGVKNVNSINNQNMWYCGPYLLKEFAEGNYKVYEPNPYYWDTKCTLFGRVVITMVGGYQEAYDLFEAGQLDYVEIDGEIAQDLIDSGSDYADNLVSKELKPYAYQMHWNFHKFDEDQPILDEDGNHAHDYYETPLYEEDDNWNKAIANEDFRLSLYYGWELSNYYARTNPVDPLKVEHNTNTMVGISYASDGRDYTELVKDKLNIGDYNGETMVRLNTELAQQHKENAMSTLLAQGVTFPVELDYYVQEDNEVAQEAAATLNLCLTESLGSEYVTINVHTYEASSTKEVRDPQFQSIAINGWGMDYSDPYNNLSQFGIDDNSYYSHYWNNIIDLLENTPSYAEEVVEQFETYASMLTNAETLSNDARLEALADAEAYLIEHGLVTPCYINVGYCIGYIDPNSMINDIMKNWVVKETLIGGGEIHDDGIIDMGVWKHAGNCFNWILKDNGTLYFTGNGEDGNKKNGNSPWEKYKNNIKKIIVSAGVTGLNGTNAFNGVKATEIIFLKYTVTIDSAGTFSLRSIPQTVSYSKLETIGEGVFSDCTELPSVDIPECVVTLGDNAFNGCTSLESIKIPTSVETIGKDAFADTDLTEIKYDGTTDDFAKISGCDDFLFDTYQNLEGEHQFADLNTDDSINIADVDLLYRKAQTNATN